MEILINIKKKQLINYDYIYKRAKKVKKISKIDIPKISPKSKSILTRFGKM